MSIASICREGSLTNLEWLGEGLAGTRDISKSKNPTNSKLELQDSFDTGDISPIFTDDSAGSVKRNMKKNETGDAGDVIFFARDMMNKGMSASEVDANLKAKFSKGSVRAASVGLRKLFALDGIVGRVAVDARGYKNCEAAMKSASASPYKRFVSAIIGCRCDAPTKIVASAGKQKVAETTGNSVDDFFSGSDCTDKTALCCASTGLRHLVSNQEIDDEWLSQTSIDITNLAGVPEKEAAMIRDMDAKPLRKIKAAFKAIDKQKAASVAKPKNANRTASLSAAVPVAKNSIYAGDWDGIVPSMKNGLDESFVETQMPSALAVWEEAKSEKRPELPVEFMNAPSSLDIDARGLVTPEMRTLDGSPDAKKAEMAVEVGTVSSFDMSAKSLKNPVTSAIRLGKLAGFDIGGKLENPIMGEVDSDKPAACDIKAKSLVGVSVGDIDADADIDDFDVDPGAETVDDFDVIGNKKLDFELDDEEEIKW